MEEQIMIDINGLKESINKKILDGELSNIDEETLEEVLRILSHDNAKEREKEGIVFEERVDGMGKKVIYLDGGRGIRLKITIR